MSQMKKLFIYKVRLKKLHKFLKINYKKLPKLMKISKNKQMDLHHQRMINIKI